MSISCFHISEKLPVLGLSCMYHCKRQSSLFSTAELGDGSQVLLVAGAVGVGCMVCHCYISIFC